MEDELQELAGNIVSASTVENGGPASDVPERIDGLAEAMTYGVLYQGRVAKWYEAIAVFGIKLGAGVFIVDRVTTFEEYRHARKCLQRLRC